MASKKKKKSYVEEEKKRLGREASLITAIPITQEACYEPTCTPNSEPEEEGASTHWTSWRAGSEKGKDLLKKKTGSFM